MKLIKHRYVKRNRPKYIVVSNYFNNITNWHFRHRIQKDSYDIGVWKIKYKSTLNK